jgi:hypothetical protein
MTRHTVTREVEVAIGSGRWTKSPSWVEVRYTFSVIKGRKATTWANASDGFAPAEHASIDLHEVAIRTHKAHDFTPLDGVAAEAFSGDLTYAWFFNEIEEQDA